MRRKVQSVVRIRDLPRAWKKPGQVLTVLLPIFGKSNTYFTCNFNTDVKDFVYIRHNGKLTSEPVARYKAWMIKHDYDPVHGKNRPPNSTPPTQRAPSPHSAASPAAPPSQ